jgi:UDP:flavonoid glycosyltransferase YjiC (YdhE family)
MADLAAWGLFRKEINRWRQDDLGLAKISHQAYFRSQRLVIKGFSPLVVPRPKEWDQDVKITGYWFPEDPGWKPPPELVKFLETGSPPVFIGFGSMPIPEPERTTDIILNALRQTGQRGVLHTGWAGLGGTNLPESVHLLDYAPYRWLFPRMSMVIHHGGSGTTGFGLRAGVPSCVVGLGFDQLFWGKRISALGAGPEPVRFQNLTSEKLAEIIHQGISNQNMKLRANEIGQAVQEEDGLTAAVRIIEEIE